MLQRQNGKVITFFLKKNKTTIQLFNVDPRIDLTMLKYLDTFCTNKNAQECIAGEDFFKLICCSFFKKNKFSLKILFIKYAAQDSKELFFFEKASQV